MDGGPSGHGGAGQVFGFLYTQEAPAKPCVANRRVWMGVSLLSAGGEGSQKAGKKKGQKITVQLVPHEGKKDIQCHP